MSDDNLMPGCSTNDLDEYVCRSCGEYHEECLGCGADLGCDCDDDYCDECDGLYCPTCGDELNEDGECGACLDEELEEGDEP